MGGLLGSKNRWIFEEVLHFYSRHTPDMTAENPHEYWVCDAPAKGVGG